jgi:hypothetical protein
MADVQISVPQVAAAPSTYEVAASAEFILKCVNADFDGSGSAGSWLPCVTIKSDSGHVVARAVDPGVSVAAGGSAEVSWFPGVKHAAAASAAGGLSWAIVSIAFDAPDLAIGATAQVVPYDLTNGSDTFFMTNDSATFSIDSTNHAIVLAQNGYYMIETWTRARQIGNANQGNFTKLVKTFSQELAAVASMTSFLGGNWTVPGYNVAGNTFWDPNSIEYADFRGVNPSWQHQLANTTGATLTCQRATFTMVRLGDAVTSGTIP